VRGVLVSRRRVWFVSSSLALLARSARGKVNFLLCGLGAGNRVPARFFFFFVGGM
jgi:hypothetical protein